MRNAVREAATSLAIDLKPLPGYSPDLMPVEPKFLRDNLFSIQGTPLVQDARDRDMGTGMPRSGENVEPSRP